MANCNFLGPLPNITGGYGVLALNLSRNSLNGTLPANLLPTPAYTSLDISDNSLEGTIVIPTTLPMRMTSLWLARNHFTNVTISPGVQYLVNFDVSGNVDLSEELQSSLFERGSILATLNISRTATDWSFPQHEHPQL